MFGLGGYVRQFLDETIVQNLRSMRTTRLHLAWLMAAVIGVAVAYAVIAFRSFIGLVQVLWLGTMTETVITAAARTPSWIIFLAPVAGGLIVGLLLQFVIPWRRPEGVADVIEARINGKVDVPVQRGLTSALISALSLGSGASAGREGPAVHIGAALASSFAHAITLPPGTRRALFGCGVAAAVTASFNAPLAGALFALEVVMGHYAVSAFIPIAIASVGSTVVTRIYLGDFPAFVVPEYQITSYLEFPAFALLGLTCGLVAICFQGSIMATDWTARRITVPLWTRPVIGGALVGAIAVFLPEIIGVGYEATDKALKQQYSLLMLFTLLIAKTAATAITIASRFGGGVFSPSLYLGAMTGGAFGIIAASAFPEMASSHGLYAIVGMGAVSAAVLGAPISTTLIVFELTGGYEVTIALLLAVSMSMGLMQAFHGHSFFHWQLSMRGIFLDEGPQRQLMRTIFVRDFLTPLKEDETYNWGEDDSIPMLTPDDTLASAIRAFNDVGLARIPVVDSKDVSVTLGWAEHVKALDALNAALNEVNAEEHR